MSAIIYILFVLPYCLAMPSLISAKQYYKENLTVLGDIYTVGIFDLKFNESLYGYHAYGSDKCFDNTSCRPNNIKCDACDWTDPLICNGTIRGPNTTCPCWPRPFICNPSAFIFPYQYWPKNSSSIVVELDNIIFIDVLVHPQPPNNCSCIIFKYDFFEGGYQSAMLLYYGELWVGGDGVYEFSEFGSCTICPSNPRWGQTHVVRVVNLKGIYAKINISLEYRDIPSNKYQSTCISPLSVNSSHQCISTNIYKQISPLPGENSIKLMINLPSNQRCGVMTFWSTAFRYLLSTNFWVSNINSTGALRSHKIGTDDGRLYPSVYPYCLESNENLYAFILSSKPVYFYIDTTKEWMLLRPFTDYGPSEFFGRFLGAVTVNCQNKSFTASLDNYGPVETMDTGTINLRMVYPSDDVDSFYPPPILANILQYSVKNVSIAPMDNKRIIVSLLLNQRLVPRAQPIVWNNPWFSTTYQWLTIDEWNECVLNIGGVIASSDGTGLSLTVSQKDITDDPYKCDSQLYSTASKQIDIIQKQALDISSQTDTKLIDVYRLWFLQDRITASNEFYFCRREMESYYTTVPVSKTINTDQCVATFNTTIFNSDPCCNLNETTLYDSCSINNRILTDQYKIDQYNNYFDNCSATECAQLSLTNMLLQLNSIRDPTSCINSVERPSDENIYWRCVLKFFGPEPVSFAGINCTHDIDCIQYGSRCDVYSKRCFINVSQSEINLISCIYDGLSQFSRTFVSNELGVDPNDINIKDLWLNSFYETLPCSDPHNPIGFNMNVATHGRCHGCDGYIFGETSVISTWSLSPGTSWANGGRDCWAPGSSTCIMSQISLTANSYCKTLACNIMPYENKTFFPYISDPSYCSNATICGITDDGFFYRDVTNVIPVSNCTNATICILANGTKIQTINSDTCEAIYSCDADCIGIDGKPIVCPDEKSCINSGICSDATDYDIGLWTGYYKDITAACFFTIKYRNPFNPTVFICDPPFRSTIIGCSNRFINESSCITGNFQWGDPNIFELISPKWITKAYTQIDCAAYGTVCEDLTHPKVAAIPTHTNTLSFETECIGSTVNQRDLFLWKSGRWLPGQHRMTQIVIGELKPRFSSTPRVGVNLPKILSNLTKAVDKLQSLKIQSAAFCRSTYKRYLDQLICSCDGYNNESFCYESKGNIGNVTSIVVLCDEISTISAGDCQISTTEVSLPPATCDNLFVESSSIVAYRSRVIVPLRTLLVNYEEDTEFSIRNQQLAIYGKVLTDGYAFNFITTITNITICIKLSSLRLNYKTNLDKYSVIDLAIRPINSLPDDLIPLYLNISVIENNIDQTDIFCTQLDILQENEIYYFIQRIDTDYNLVQRTVFSNGEIAYISVLLTLYCIGLISDLCRIIYIYYMHFTTEIESRIFPYRLLFVLILIGSFFIFRIVLFSFLLDNTLLGLSSTRSINYVLFEFPIILYFAFVTSYICLWVIAILFVDKITVNWANKRKMALLIFILVNSIIIVLFIIMVILFETIINPPYLACDGFIYVFDSTKSYNLLLAYRIIFSSIAIIVGITLFIVAIKVGNLLGNPDLNIPWYSRLKIYLISVVGGLGLIGQAIYFLIVTATQSTPNNYVSLSILLVLEIIPSLLFVFVEQFERSGRKSSGFTTSKTNKSKTSKKSDKSGKSDLSDKSDIPGN
jgi:hypothetical protein